MGWRSDREPRRFFCVEPGCGRKVFTEPLPGTVARYGRRSGWVKGCSARSSWAGGLIICGLNVNLDVRQFMDFGLPPQFQQLARAGSSVELKQIQDSIAMAFVATFLLLFLLRIDLPLPPF